MKLNINTSYLSPFLFLIGGILILPLLPFWNYINLCHPFLILLNFLLIIYNTHTIKIDSLSLTDIGFIIFTFSVLFSFIHVILSIGVIPLDEKYLTFFLMIITYYSLSKFSSSITSFRLINKLLLTFYVTTACFIFYTAFQVGFNYPSLTSRFDYLNGLGNISQLSMYCSFYLIGIFYTQKNNWLIAGICCSTILLILILQSKLLALVLIILLMGRFLAKYSFKIQSIVLAIIAFVGLAFLYFMPVSSLLGRSTLFQISLQNYNYSHFWGVGLGRYDAYINNIFKDEIAINTIGHIDHLAFNDFVQTFVELGYLGVIALGIVLIGLINKQKLFYVIAIVVILGTMFPMQYPESAILFILTISLFRSKTLKRIPRWTVVSFNLKPILIFINCLLILLVAQHIKTSIKWYELEQQISEQTNIGSKLKQYQLLEDKLSNNDQYHISIGIHYLNNKKYNNALKAFNKAQLINPSYESFVYIGNCYFKLSYYEEALTYYHSALLIRPKHLYPVYKSIYCLKRLNQMEKASSYWLAKQANYKKLYSPKMITMKKEIEQILSKR